jgi:hypothetical protein
MNDKKAHYYGDIVRKLFLAAAIFMIVLLPFMNQYLEAPIYISILAAVGVGVFAGGPTSLGAPIGSGNIRISNNTNTMNGVMDDARVYNRILSPSEIKQLYSLGR